MRALVLATVSAENPCSQKYEVENGSRKVIASLPIIGFSFLTNEAMTFLLPFSTTYLCEQGFSALTLVKTKARNRLSPGSDLRVALSKIDPWIEEIVKGK